MACAYSRSGNSWPGLLFEPGDGVIPDPVFNAKFLHQFYTSVAPDYSGRLTEADWRLFTTRVRYRIGIRISLRRMNQGVIGAL